MKLHEVNLRTNRPEAVRDFYTEKLKLQLLHNGPDVFTLRAGNSRLTFHRSEESAYYHFAFNIPASQVEAAHDWLSEQTVLLSDQGETIIDFSNWNARALYFEDPAGNIVEFIGRRDLQLAPVRPFRPPTGIRSLSEIGLSVGKVSEAFAHLQETAGTPRYSGNGPTFLAAGDPEGLFILVDPEEKAWYPTDRPARFFPLEVEFSESGEAWRLQLDDSGLELKKAR